MYLFLLLVVSCRCFLNVFFLYLLILFYGYIILSYLCGHDIDLHVYIWLLVNGIQPLSDRFCSGNYAWLTCLAGKTDLIHMLTFEGFIGCETA